MYIYIYTKFNPSEVHLAGMILQIVFILVNFTRNTEQWKRDAL